MVIYEITALVEPEIRPAFEEYMAERHINDLLATGYFISAYLSKNVNRYRILYFAKSAETLEDYLRHDAARLRAEVIERFPSGIEVSREQWQVIAMFER